MCVYVHECVFVSVCMNVSLVSERAKRASSVIVHVNRDFRYVYIYLFICGRTSTSTRMPGKSLLRNGLSN